MDGPTIMQGLIARGYSPVQAAALGGHMLQESGGDPTNVNPKEDAHGLLQWRGDRWDNLQALAKSRGVSPTDPNVQLDFIGQEMAGPEAKAGAAFNAGGDDLAATSAALKRYIRFGDNSDGARLNNARGLLSQPGIANAGMIPQASPAPVQQGTAPAAGVAPNTSPAAVAPAPDDTAFMASLQNIPKMLAAQQANQQYAPAPIAPDNLRARMAAIAAARQGTA
jgi:hypothetical protein